tara:strand:- start:1573 stop:2676 length:1104 start_codon:yes stop_codon:yes gene_type:complete
MISFRAEELLGDAGVTPPAFDDVLLVPAYSSLSSRLSSEIDLRTRLSSTFRLGIPIISSPMDTVTESQMALSLGGRGAMGVIHRFMTPERQVEEINSILTTSQIGGGRPPVAFAIGVGKSEKIRFDRVYSQFPESIDWVSIDVANGHSEYMLDMLRWVKNRIGNTANIMVGNVATGDGYKFLADAGADAIRVGIGGGSICKTRLMTGFGVPTLSSVIDCYRAKANHKYDAAIIADGGIRYPADFVKSLAAGADAIMAGRMFAGTIESPGEIVLVNGVRSKTYRGMASREVQEDKRGGLKPGTCAEGVSTHIPLKGKAHYILDEFSGGLRSALTYCNARNIRELRENARFIRMSQSSLDESHAFGTKI